MEQEWETMLALELVQGAGSVSTLNIPHCTGMRSALVLLHVRESRPCSLGCCNAELQVVRLASRPDGPKSLEIVLIVPPPQHQPLRLDRRSVGFGADGPEPSRISSTQSAVAPLRMVER